MALLTTQFPDTSGKTTEQKIQILLDNYNQLRKELEYLMQNISTQNFSNDLTTKLDKTDSSLEKVNEVIDTNGKVIADKVAGTLSTALANITNSTGTVEYKDFGIIIHDQPTEAASTKAMKFTADGFSISNKKDINGVWIWRTFGTGDGFTADDIVAGILSAITINGVNITGSTMLVQHDDGSSTKIDGSGITRIFSVPIFEELPTDTDIIDNFETGNIANTRVDLASTQGFGKGLIGNTFYNGKTVSDFIFITTDDKHAGTYSLKIKTPGAMYDGSGTVDYDSYINCYFLNYRPTKNTTFSLYYKLPAQSNTIATLCIDDLDYPEIATQSIALTSATWALASALLTSQHTYRIYIKLSINDGSNDQQSILYIDDVTFELDVNESVITGYEQSEHTYYDFTYVRKDEILTGTTQKQITLPDYFRGLNFDVLISARETYAAPTLLSINNKVPSFTVSGENTKFIYTIILNN